MITNVSLQLLSNFDSYGIGPHRVKFTIDVLKEGGKRSLQSFIVETAPVELMPASIHMFLDMISAGIWDNTVFLHHEEVEHVVAAAHVDANTQQVRLNEISKIGWIGLGYPEYSDSFKHKQYTLGFAGVGPNFYINTLDNSIDHGPGGQLHHTLPSDADPCFAKVVEGFNVVDDLIRLGSLKNNTKGQGKHPWIDASHSSTRIVSAMMLDS